FNAPNNLLGDIADWLLKYALTTAAGILNYNNHTEPGTDGFINPSNNKIVTIKASSDAWQTGDPANGIPSGSQIFAAMNAQREQPSFSPNPRLFLFKPRPPSTPLTTWLCRRTNRTSSRPWTWETTSALSAWRQILRTGISSSTCNEGVPNRVQIGLDRGWGPPTPPSFVRAN